MGDGHIAGERTLRKFMDIVGRFGWIPWAVDDGDGEWIRVSTAYEAIEAASAVDESHIQFRFRPGSEESALWEPQWIYVVFNYGDPDSIADHSCGNQSWIEACNLYWETNEAEWSADRYPRLD